MYSSLNEKNGTPWGGGVSDVNILPLMFSAGSKKNFIDFPIEWNAIQSTPKFFNELLSFWHTCEIVCRCTNKTDALTLLPIMYMAGYGVKQREGLKVSFLWVNKMNISL